MARPKTLIEALRSCERLAEPGRLIALIGRGTFSAAGNFVTALERETSAVLIGEPTGGAPNQYGDSRPIRLPNHPEIRVLVATRHHVFDPDDEERRNNEPDVPVPYLASDYFGARDPVLERALAYRP